MLILFSYSKEIHNGVTFGRTIFTLLEDHNAISEIDSSSDLEELVDWIVQERPEISEEINFKKINGQTQTSLAFRNVSKDEQQKFINAIAEKFLEEQGDLVKNYYQEQNDY